jgi:8-oxo-dGTP pyrophosphatase MutT (NUDIX family)
VQIEINSGKMIELNVDGLIKRLKSSYNPALPPEYPYPFYFSQQDTKPGFKKAAVLIPFLQDGGNWYILFIRRTKKQEDIHSGQVAFPGGSWEPSDRDAVQAAYREAHEEIGIPPDQIMYLGQLRELITVTKFLITPVVAKIPWPYPLVPQPNELSRIFTIPFEWICDPSNRSVRFREHPETRDKYPVIYFKPFDGEILWGASARITHLLLEGLGMADPENRYKD